MKAILRVDGRLCRGTGLCEAMSPQLFKLGDARQAAVLQPELSDAEQITMARTVAECCPTEAITVMET
jgi:ferredoxin